MTRFDIQKLWAKIDFMIVFPMAIPPIADLVLQMLAAANTLWLNGALDYKLPDLLGLSLMAVLAVIWALARLNINSSMLMRLDIFGRTYIAALIIYACIFMNYAPVLLIFVITELVGAAHQGWNSRHQPTQ